MILSEDRTCKNCIHFSKFNSICLLVGEYTNLPCINFDLRSLTDDEIFAILVDKAYDERVGG